MRYKGTKGVLGKNLSELRASHPTILPQIYDVVVNRESDKSYVILEKECTTFFS